MSFTKGCVEFLQAREQQMRNAQKKRQADRTVVRWLIFCFPVGLLLMWSDRCSFRRWVKSAISFGFVMLALMLALPQTRAPQPKKGGVEMVSMVASADVMGPTMRPDALRYEVYVPKYIPKNSVVVQPTPSPVPYYVYCNDGGEFYHAKKCKYVRDNTPKVTIVQAVDAGFKRCKTCKPPKLAEVYPAG